MEGIDALVKWRAKDLERGIRELLNDPDGASVTKTLFAHPLIHSLFTGEYDPAYLKRRTALTGVGRQMHMRLLKRRNLPSYIPAENFASALIDTIARGAVSLLPNASPAAPVVSIESIRAGNRNPAQCHARGRTVIPPTHTVTNAPTNLYSWHGYGLAVAVVHEKHYWEPPEGETWFKSLSESFAKFACNWGGHWKHPDTPHFQWALQSRAFPMKARKLLATGGLQAVWQVLGAVYRLSGPPGMCSGMW